MCLLKKQLPKTRDGIYVINLDEYKSIGTHGIVLYVNRDNVTYFDSFGVEHEPKEIRKLIGNKNITTSIYRIQAFNLIMCGYFCIGVIEFMLQGKRLLDYKKLYFPNEHEKNDNIYKYYINYIDIYCLKVYCIKIYCI